MNLWQWMLTLGLAAAIWRLGRAVPLTGRKRTAAVWARMASVALVCLTLWSPAPRRAEPRPQHVIYLADVSPSMDAQQRRWIARRIASLEALRPSRVQRALIAFDAEARLLVPFGREPLANPEALERLLARSTSPAARTNVEAALLAALRQLPPEQGGRVVLLSDGRETAGDAGSVLAHVRRLGLQVFPEPVPMFGASTTVWDELSVTPSVQRGAPIGVQLSLYRPGPQPTVGELTISLAGIPVKRQRVRIQPGWQVLSTSVPAVQQGTMALDVRLVIPEDRIDERRSAYTDVEGPAHVLVVADQPATLPFVANALKRREMEISLARPRDLPTAPGALLDYDAVLLVNIPKSSLGADQVEALRGYLERFGGGLVAVGMGGDIANEIRTAAPLDALLPVIYEAKGLQEAKRRVCLVMLIDRSASMIGPRLSATKRAAVALVNQLQPEDLIGILTFDTQPYVVVEVQQA
ncbi:MAG: VWA domain-containing protein, partial [Candidatus Omnitrophica bacterium]|nr:VWA domain-containing protein [Candidatus Omnitrophota bacterium]